MDDDQERVSEATKQAERAEMDAEHEADREPTAEEEEKAESRDVDPEVAEHAEEMYKTGAQVKGEGELP